METEKNGKPNKDKLFITITVSALILAFLYLLYGASKKEFWFDEVAIIGFISEGKNLHGILDYYLTIEASNLPLYALILVPFYYLFPPKEIWILLPGILMTLGGIAVLVRIANRYIGRIAAYVILVIGLTSTTVLNRMGLELRAYALMFFLSAIVLEFYMRAEEKPSKVNLILLWISGIGLMYSHYFGCLCLGCLGIFSLYDFWIKKKSWKLPCSILASALCFLPWFIMTMRKTNVSVEAFWIEPPKYTQMMETIGYLVGGNYIFCVLFGIGFLWLLFDVIKKKEEKGTLLLVMIILIIGGVFIYSKYVSPGGGLYENRYFLVILPHILLTIAYGVQQSFKIITFHRLLPIGITILLLIGIGVGGRRSYLDTITQYDVYSESASYILEQEENCEIIMASYGGVDEVANWGWFHYYLERRGEANAVNVISVTSGTIDSVIEACPTSINRIYVFGDLDHAAYTGKSFNELEQGKVNRLMILERN